MSLSSPFINRPVATTLLTIAVALAGALAYTRLPVAPLPEVDYPAINVSAGLPGASPATMASAVATPLERQFSRIAGVTEMTSSSNVGSTNITLLFDLNRDINAAARDVQAAINAAGGGPLPANLPSKPSFKKINPADSPIMILYMTSPIYDRAAMYDKASTILAQKLSQVNGVGEAQVGGSSLPAVRVELNPPKLNGMGLSLDNVKSALAAANANTPKGTIRSNGRIFNLATTDQLFKAADYRNHIIVFRNGAPVRVGDVGEVDNSVEDILWVLHAPTGLRVYDFDFNLFLTCKHPWRRPKTIHAVARTGVYEDYETRYNELEHDGVILIHSPEDHLQCSELPQWYPLLADLTPKSIWFDQIPSPAEVGDAIGWPMFLKGQRQTSRHKRAFDY